MLSTLLRLLRNSLWLAGSSWILLMSLPAYAAGVSDLQLTTNTRHLFGGLQSQCQPTGQAGSTQTGPALGAYCQSVTQSTTQQAGNAQAEVFANEQQASQVASNASAGTSNNLNAQNQTSGMNSAVSQVKKATAQTMKGMAQQLAQHAQGLQQYIQLAEQEAGQLEAQGQQMVNQGQMMQQFTPTYGNGVMMENLGNQKLEQAKDLRKFAGDVDSNVKAKYDAEAPQYEANASQDLADAGELGSNSSTASSNGQGMEALGQLAKGAGGGGQGGGGSSSPTGVTGPSSISTNTGKTDSFLLADSATRGSSSASMADPSDFFKKSNDFSAGFGNGAKSSPASTASASVANLKEKLQAERAARSAASSGGGAGGASGGSSANDANGAAAAGPVNGVSQASSSIPGGSGLGDMGLSIGMGDPKFDDAMKGLLGLESGNALSEEERALLASRELASLGGFEPLPPEVLGAESASLFERTRDRIVVSLKQGKILGGLSSKLK